MVEIVVGVIVTGAVPVPVPEGVVELFIGKGALEVGIVGSTLDGALVVGSV